MNYIFLIIILFVGLSGIAAQVLILRELLVSFLGNELTLGIVLANWVIAEALGVFSVGRLIDKIKNKTNVFIILQIIFSLTLPVSIYLARTFKGFFGIPSIEGIGLAAIFYSSLMIIFASSFTHGALFACATKLYAQYTRKSVESIGKIYTFETIGTIIGGILLTYFFIPRLNSFQIVFIISIANLLICLIFLKPASVMLRYILLLALSAMSVFSILGGLKILQQASIEKQWKGQQVIDYRNSVYGNILVAKKEKQLTFFYNGAPIITAPYPDITFVQEFGNIPLLFHQAPQELLIVGAGAGGLINEALKHPLAKIDYAELDPLLIKMLKDHPTELTQKEFNDKRLRIINIDARLYLKDTPHQYDLILIGISKPADLSTNRLFTQEFFLSAKKKLKSNGLISLWLPGSLTYLSQELKDLNACILNSLKNSYNYVRVIPGDYNIFLASDSKGLLEVTPDIITQRISQRNIKASLLVPDYLAFRLNRRQLAWFQQSLNNATLQTNRDFRPLALFQMLAIWNRQFSASSARIFGYFRFLRLRQILAFIILLTLVVFLINRRKGKVTKLAIVYSVATTGFFGMLANLILIFSFQVFFGYLYYKIGLLISIFMSGIALGSIIMTHRLKDERCGLGLLIKLEASALLFSFLLAWLVPGFARFNSALIFSILFFLSGMLIGLEFPLANKIYLAGSNRIGEAAGMLYFSDLLGSWLAGMLVGIIFLPILGLFNTCLVAALLKLSSLFILTSSAF